MLTRNEIIDKFPSLFRLKTENAYNWCGFSSTGGWNNIIYCLCRYIDYDRAELENKIQRANSKNDLKTAEILQAQYDNSAWPTIGQIKEKYGTLRFYADHTTTAEDNYIEFAESMSGVTCEVCGNPGEIRRGSWIVTRCDEHAKNSDS